MFDKQELNLPKDDQPIMYKLVRIDDNGMFHLATEEDLMEVESLIQAETSEEEHTDEEDGTCAMEEDNFENVKMRLLKQLEYVDTMLLRVRTDEDQQSNESGGKYTYKRRRRPNPKYYNNNGNIVEEYPPNIPNNNNTDIPQIKTESPQVKTESPPGQRIQPPASQSLVKEEDSSSKLENATTPTQTPPKLFLDNLSIRALQDTYRDTFGRGTSAKDKHWLKRKIAKGLSAMNEAMRPQIIIGSSENSNMIPKERLDLQNSAEQPYLMVTSPTVSLDASTTTVVSRPSDGQSHVNEVQSLEGKRHRKPNRRYVEEESDDLASSLGRNVSSPEENMQQNVPSDYGYSDGEEELDDEDDDDDDLDDEDLVDDLDMSPVDSPDGLGARKRNRAGAERRAAQLVKMARNVRSKPGIRKIKFKLPPASGQDNDENYEPNDDSADQVSCMLPSVSDELQPSDMEDQEQDTDRKSGSRRKHHRPWTLREVLALVDGVSRCGTGKWADIKRLSFSAITYRTPVDLKDKWRNLLRASRVHSHSSRQGEKRRKHFSVSIPANILARVRELAAQPGQTLKLPVIRSTRSRRMIQRKI